VRWQYRDGALLWTLAAAYGVHVAEEWFTGFPAWTGRIVGRPVPDAAFLVINAVAAAVLITAIRLATRRESSGWIAVAIATIVLVNTMGHAAGAVFTGSYAPGLVSAVLLYVPLGSLTMIRAMDQAPREQLVRGIVAGVLIHTAVVVVAFASTRL